MRVTHASPPDVHPEGFRRRPLATILATLLVAALAAAIATIAASPASGTQAKATSVAANYAGTTNAQQTFAFYPANG